MMAEESLIREINELKKQLCEKERNLKKLQEGKTFLQNYGLHNEEITRYSRQILMPEVGVKGQIKLKRSAVLVVGMGGLGCPIALYLAGAGVGHIGLVDYDEVDLTNLHRQLLYTEDHIGLPKVKSAAEVLLRLNSNVEVVPYKMQLDSRNALDLIKKYDVILDATDNVATRYLLNDACVLAKKPLVSGSALKFEGQLTVYNYGGPCYRCLFPKPPPPETVTNCGDGGVLGAVVGTIGLLQALEALKIMLDIPSILAGRLLLFDGTETVFRNIKLRPKNPDCPICGENPTITELIDYEEFCGAKANDKNPNLILLENSQRISVLRYHQFAADGKKSHLLVDVRSAEEFEICRLNNAINIPFNEIGKDRSIELIKRESMRLRNGEELVEVFVICRRGNDSQKAVKLLQKSFQDAAIRLRDVIGGIHAWSFEIDPTFPIY